MQFEFLDVFLLFLTLLKLSPGQKQVFYRNDIVICTKHFHEFSFYPPRELPEVILKQKETYRAWLTIYRNFAKVERFGIGQKIEDGFLAVLELTFTASYLPIDQKIILLTKVISKLDAVKFFIQLAWETKLIPTEKYINLGVQLEEIGRQLGGWRKGLQTKTPRP